MRYLIIATPVPPVLDGASQVRVTSVVEESATVVGWFTIVLGIVADKIVVIGEKPLHPWTF